MPIHKDAGSQTEIKALPALERRESIQSLLGKRLSVESENTPNLLLGANLNKRQYKILKSVPALVKLPGHVGKYEDKSQTVDDHANQIVQLQSQSVLEEQDLMSSKYNI